MSQKSPKQSNDLLPHLRLNANLLRSAGFTIVELMIASVVFSLVLILITYGVIRFNQAYYGGVVQSTTQNVARSIIDNISQSIQFDGGDVTILTTPGWNGICVGNQFYQYQLGYQLKTDAGALKFDQARQAMLLTDNVANCSGQTPGTVGGATPGTPGGNELLGEHMRLANLKVTQVSGTDLYSINARVVYGDGDLLCALSVPGSCDSPSSTSGAMATDTECKSNTGTPQFCAVSDLTTTVEKRIN